MNYSCQVQLRPITLTKQTFVEVRRPSLLISIVQIPCGRHALSTGLQVPLHRALCSQSHSTLPKPCQQDQCCSVQMSVSFLTEPAAVEGMHNSMRYFNETCLQSLCHYLGHRASMATARSMPQASGSNKPVRL